MLIEPTDAEIALLAQKLDEFSDVLTDRERNFLFGFFSLAGKELADLAQQAGSVGTTPTSEQPAPKPKLSDAFKSSLKSAKTARYQFEGERPSEAISVGGECVTWSN